MVLNFLKTSYNKVKTALTKTGSLLGNKLRSLLKGKINEETLEELEQLFYEADLGIQTSLALTEKVRDFDIGCSRLYHLFCVHGNCVDYAILHSANDFWNF